MDKNRINEMVDKKIIEFFSQDKSIREIESDLVLRMNNFKKTIAKKHDFQQLYNMDFSQIPEIRFRYGITYIKQCEKRLTDLDWILKNRSLFKTFTDLKLFKLLLLRDKVTQKEPNN